MLPSYFSKFYSVRQGVELVSTYHERWYDKRMISLKKKAAKHKRMKLLLFLILGLFVAIAGWFAFRFVTLQQGDSATTESALSTVEPYTPQTQDYAGLLSEHRKNQAVYITLPGADPIRALIEDYDQPDSQWVLVNKQNAAPTTYVPEALAIPDVETRTDRGIEERSVRTDIIAQLEKMIRAAEADGHFLMIGSAYRPASLQQLYFDNYSRVAGFEAANQYSALPGQSEHQLGLAVDLSTVSRECYLSACFTNLPDGAWLATNAHKYGFHLRYQLGKESITGYQFEPWHYRYLGVDLATALYRSELTLEEAWPYLQEALTSLRENGAI